MSRNYTRERLLESGKDKEKRAVRNRARRMMFNHLASKYGAKRAELMMNGKDVDHIKPLESGGKNSIKNLRLTSQKKNRSDKSAVKDPGRNKKR